MTEERKIVSAKGRAFAAEVNPQAKPGGPVAVETALDDVRAGRMIILVDDDDREN